MRGPRSTIAVRTTSPSQIRVVIGEDNLLTREGVTRVVEGLAGIELAGVAADLPALRRVVDEARPDVVVTDIRMPPDLSDEGLRLAHELRDSHPHLGVVMLSSHAEPAYALALFSNGSEGRAYLLKERLSQPAELERTIRAVAEGGSAVDPKLVERLLAGSRRDDGQLDGLTPRELEVLAQVAQGRSNAAIADSFEISKRAVEHHVNAIFRKLGLEESADVSRRVMAALVYLDRAGA